MITVTENVTKRLAKLCAVCVFLCLGVAAATSAATRYVWTNGSHTAPYTTWPTAATNIAAATSIATPNDVIIVTNGIYSESAQIDLNDNRLILRSVNGPAATVLDGRGTHRVLYSNNSGVAIEGFTITNGTLSGNGGGIYVTATGILVSNCIISGNTTTGAARLGAGIWCNLATILDCTIQNNYHCGTGTSQGGGAYCQNSARLVRCYLEGNYAVYGGGAVMNDTTADGCAFTANVASNRGAGVYAPGIAQITNCTFSANKQLPVTDSGNGGGGIFFDGAGSAISCAFLNNRVVCYGGGVYINGVAASVTQCTLIGNRTTVSGAGTGGGGIYALNNGFVRDCLFSGNLAMNDGGGLLMDGGGAADRCRFMYNTVGDWGGGLAVYNNGSVSNSLFHGNIADEGGGIYNYGDGARIHSCTVVKNTANIGGGGIDCGDNTLVRNAIVYDNYAATYTNYRNQTANARWRNCCTWPAITGAADEGGTITNPPVFLAAAYNHYQLATNSPCINVGSNEAWMVAAQDLTPQARIINRIVDIGAFELGRLTCALSANRRAGRKPFAVDFSSYVTGTNTATLYYYWDFNYPSGFDTNGLNVRAPSWSYTNDGIYTVYLLVSNAVGEIATYLATDFIIVVSDPRYVATNGLHIAPYTSWATAASNIESAVAISYDFMLVFVSAGTYRITSPIVLTSAVEVYSVCGPEQTIVDGAGTTRCFYIATEARLNGFTISNGSAQGSGIDSYGGGAICFNNGFVSNCHFTMNRTMGRGGGVACYDGGTIHTCLFRTNTAVRGGGALCFNQGLIMNSTFTANRATDRGGAVFCDSFGTVRNCLAYGNTAATNGGGISIHDSGGIVQSCTVSSNAAYQGGGIHSQSGGNYYNTISYFNTATVAADSNWYSTVVGTEYERSFQYCCTAPLAGLPYQVGCISTDPQFRSIATLDYRLRATSACLNAGVNQAWMSGNVDLDFNPRIREARVDIGAYEYVLALLRITNTANQTVFPFRYLHHLTAGVSTGLLGSFSYSNVWSDGVSGGISIGSMPAATTWSVPQHLPHFGTYTFSIRGTNLYGEVLEDRVIFTRGKYKVFSIRAQ